MEHEPPLEFTVRVALPKLAALKGGDTENSADMDLDIGLSGLFGDFVPFLNGGSEPGAFVSEALELFFNDPFSLWVIGDFPFRQQLGDAVQEGVTLLAVLIAMLSFCPSSGEQIQAQERDSYALPLSPGKTPSGVCPG